MNESVINGLPDYTFSFSGDHLCLDFINTLGDRLMERQSEHLNRYEDLLAWSVQAEILSLEQAVQLQKTAQERTEQAEWVLRQAIELRETMYRIFLAVAQEQEPRDEDLLFLSRRFAETMARGRLVSAGEHCVWHWEITADSLESMLWFVVGAAEELLTEEKEFSSVRLCAADDCGWLFLDTSKNHSRRWCDMKSCGNRTKVRKFYERGRKKQELSVEN